MSRCVPRDGEKAQKIKLESLIEEFNIGHVRKNRGDLLSGGERRRTEIARCLASDPNFILLDEPFSHIDNFKKQNLRRNVFSYLKKQNISCIVATHDKDDVLGYADNMIVLNNNKIEAQNTPEQLYKKPQTPLVASFFGEFNIIDNNIVYAHQLKMVAQSALKVIVKNSYFKGHYYLIEADLDGEKVFFESSEKIIQNTEIYLEAIT